jgi:hypothetical protein
VTATLAEVVIPDDSGIIAIVDALRYRPFIGPEWTLEQILERFRRSMAEQCLLIWSTGSEGNWRVSAALRPPEPSPYPSAQGTIQVSGTGLYAVSYDSLTMAAQFEDEPVPQPHEEGNLIQLERGVITRG